MGVKTPPGTLLLMQPVGTLVEGMPKPTAPQQKHAQPVVSWGHWNMDCPQERLDTGGEVPTSQIWRVECPQGHPGTPGDIPTSP